MVLIIFVLLMELAKMMLDQGKGSITIIENELHIKSIHIKWVKKL